MLARRPVEGQVLIPKFCRGFGHFEAGCAARWPVAAPRGRQEETWGHPAAQGEPGRGAGGALPDVQPGEKHRCFLITGAEGEGRRRVCPNPSQRRQPGQRPPSRLPLPVASSALGPEPPPPGLLLLFSWARGYLMNLSEP